MIRDGDESKSQKDLITEFIQPAMLAQARFLDQVVLGQYPRFLEYGSGHLQNAGTQATLTKLRQKQTENKVYMDGRNLVLTPALENDFLNITNFVTAQNTADDGTAIREAYMGRRFGYNLYTCQNMASVNVGNTVVQGAVNNAAGYPVGTTTMTIDGLSAALPVNSWFTVDTDGTHAGDDTPQRVISSVGGATPTSVTFWPGLKNAVVDNAVITRYSPGTVNNGAGYAIGYAKEITVSNFSVAAQVGQLVTFGVLTTNPPANPIYTIIGVTSTTGITLDRPLEVALADTDKVNIGPPGHYNMAFHKNALALVVRPLALPMAGTGARAASVNYNGLSMRAVITYDGKSQGHRVTLDMLCGIALLDKLLGAVLFS